MEICVDVLIVGGGMAGLSTLDCLVSQGYKNSLLVTASDLGTGQSLHNHGWLHNGYMLMPKEEYVKIMAASAAKFVAKTGVTGFDDSLCYFSIPEPAEQALSCLEKCDLPYEVVDESKVSDIFKGGRLFSGAKVINAKKDKVFDKKAAIGAIAKLHPSNIVKGEVKAIHVDASKGLAYQAVIDIGASSSLITVTFGMIILAGGCGNSGLLTSIEPKLGTDSEKETVIASLKEENHQITKLFHVICVRGPQDVLPMISLGRLDTAFVVAHKSGDEVLWLFHDQKKPPPFVTTSISSDGVAIIQPLKVREALDSIFDLIPNFKNISHQLKWGAFACHKADGFAPMYIGRTKAVSNLIVAHPGFVVLATVLASKIVSEIVPQIIQKPTEFKAPSLPEHSSIGACNDEMVEYHSWSEFCQLYDVGNI